MSPTGILGGVLDHALQIALGFEEDEVAYQHFQHRICTIAEGAFDFSRPMKCPQRDALNIFVQKSMKEIDDLLPYAPPCTGVEMHVLLQRYGASYLAWKSGYFDRPKPLTIKLNFGLINKRHTPVEPPPPNVDDRTTIRQFLSGCHPPMLHLLDKFLSAGITGQVPLSMLCCREKEELKEYLTNKSIGQNALEIEALVLALLRRSASHKLHVKV
ncbi:hypothetical protein MIND_01073600 [Mycena indigotica]|uniref:Uncharacterized protein n=1 Tax=Mycena indigotica TaxID=2126181 RepID=A0A8H6SAF1_9AGAR|nr:uncharacterized protein MIND_01073600 [Mycena indigotica]KAF7295342.1 hypothetical protein MIND_01073600 [Mycena indigotica]